MKNFQNPWTSLPETDKFKTSFIISGKAHAALTRCHRRAGIMQTIVAILVEKLIHELESNGITEYDPAKLELAICESRIILGGVQRSAASSGNSGSNIPSTGQTSDRNDGRGTIVMARPIAGAQESPNTSSASNDGRARKWKNKRKETQS